MSLNATQINALQSYISNNDIAGFYTQLESYGDSYGRLGLAVTLNNTWQGQMANGFAKSGAIDNGIVLTYGSAIWGELNQALASRYLLLYAINNGETPTWDQVKAIHNQEYVLKGLDPNDWLPNKLLAESSNPSALWSDYLVNTGAVDLWQDAGGIIINLLHPTYDPMNGIGLNAGAPEEIFTRNFLVSFSEMSPAYRDEMIQDYNVITEFGQELQGFSELLNDSLAGLGHHYNQALNGLENVGNQIINPLTQWFSVLQNQFDRFSTRIVDPLVIDLDEDGVKADVTIGS